MQDDFFENEEPVTDELGETLLAWGIPCLYDHPQAHAAETERDAARRAVRPNDQPSQARLVRADAAWAKVLDDFTVGVIMSDRENRGRVTEPAPLGL